MPQLFTVPEHYAVTYTRSAPRIDGDINDSAWQQAAWTADFTDIEGSLKPTPRYNTKIKMLWDDSCLYVAARLQEPHLWAKVTQHDQIIFNDNDFEIFIDPDNDTRQYFEIEVNQLNKVFDLFMAKPYRSNADALFSWNAPGMVSAVKLQGTLNQSNDTDTCWTAEFRIPFKAVNLGNEVHPPTGGSVWRINFSRVEWDTEIQDGQYIKVRDASGRNVPEHNWVWSPQGVINMHYPERWGYLLFTKAQNGSAAKFAMPYADRQKQYLWLVYYQQQRYYQQHHTYAASLTALGINAHEFTIEQEKNILATEGSAYQFLATITDGTGKVWSINNDGLIKYFN